MLSFYKRGIQTLGRDEKMTIKWIRQIFEANSGKCGALTQLLLGPAHATQRRQNCAGCPFLEEKDSARDDLIEPQTMIDTSGQMPSPTQIGKDSIPPINVMVDRVAQGDNNPKGFFEQMADRLDPTKPLQPDAMIPGIAPYMGESVEEGSVEGNTVDRCKMTGQQVFSLRPECQFSHWQGQARKELKDLLEGS